MWKGVFPAVTTKFDENGNLDHAEMERCFGYQIDGGCDALIVCGSLGEGTMLSEAERLEVLKTAQASAGGRPVLMTVAEAATRDLRTPWMSAARLRRRPYGIRMSPLRVTFTTPNWAQKKRSKTLK